MSLLLFLLSFFLMLISSWFLAWQGYLTVALWFLEMKSFIYLGSLSHQSSWQGFDLHTVESVRCPPPKIGVRLPRTENLLHHSSGAEGEKQVQTRKRIADRQ